MPYSPPPAKTEISDTYPNPSNAVARAGFGTLWDYVTGLLGMTGNPAAAQTALQLVPGTNVQAYSSTLQSYANGNTLGFKNRIINGAMMIDQRNAGASITPTANVYSLDRWYALVGAASKMSFQQSSTAATGFTKSLVATTVAAYTPGATETFALLQPIEGFNVADLGFGTANAATVTLSFWVRSSLTGTFGGALANDGYNRSYPFTYTISAANTWEQKSVTIAGDTTGTWTTGNSAGLRVYFGLGVGSTYSGTAGAWTGSFKASATGATSVVGTNGATLYITGVQLEKGSTATSFDYRPYGTELALCQRYAIVYGRDQTYNEIGGTGWAFSTTQIDIPVAVPVQMRSTPTVSTSGSFQASDGAAATAITSISIITTQSSSLIASLRGVVASGLTTYRPYRIETNNSTTANVLLSAEL